MNTVLWTAAIVFTTYAWIRFCDLVVKPWLARQAVEQPFSSTRFDAYVAALDAYYEQKRQSEAQEARSVVDRIREAGQ